MTVSTFRQPDVTADTGTVYKAAIDAAIAVLKRQAAAFAAHEQSTPDMTVRLDAGMVLTPTGITEVAAQSTGTITAPSGNPRIDRIVVDQVTGAVSVITGAEADPPTAPNVTAGKVPIAQVLLDNSPATTSIANSLITDERGLQLLGALAELAVDTINEATSGAGVAIQSDSGTGEKLRTKVIQIDDWDMDANSSVNVAHGLTLAKIRSVSALIRRDDDALYFDFHVYDPAGANSRQITVGSTNITLNRSDSGTFDTTDYNSTSYNRGWITIIYAI